MYYPHKIDLTLPQKKKLLRGYTVQIKPTQIGTGSTVLLSDLQSHNFRKCAKCGKGMRLQFRDNQQSDHNVIHGEGFKDILKRIKKGFNTASNFIDPKKGINIVSKYVNSDNITKGINTAANYVDPNKKIRNAVAPYVKPVLKDVVKLAIPGALTAIGAATGQPELVAAAPIVNTIAQKSIDRSGLGFKLADKKKIVGKAKYLIGGNVVMRKSKGGALNPSGY